MKCDEALEMMSLYLDNELDPVSEKELFAHIATCKDCNTELSELKGLLTGLDNVPFVELPIGYHDELMGKLKKQTPNYVASFPQKKRAHWQGYGAMVAAFLLVVMAGGGIGKIMSENQSRLQLNKTEKSSGALKARNETDTGISSGAQDEQNEKDIVLVEKASKGVTQIDKRDIKNGKNATTQETLQEDIRSVSPTIAKTKESNSKNNKEDMIKEPIAPRAKEERIVSEAPFRMMMASDVGIPLEEEPKLKHLFMELEVKDLQKAVETVHKEAEKLNGSILEQSVSGAVRGEKDIILEIPSSRYEEAVQMLMQLGIPITKQESIEVSKRQQVLEKYESAQAAEQSILLQMEQGPTESLKRQQNDIKKTIATYEKQLENWKEEDEHSMITTHFKEEK